ncbi:MlaD family protein [Piscinibacter sakaiensis]|uniref:MCE-family protein MCE4B n=1 Tax=Piscinibacter sakaiensis TaxID=1547922 RepID=A0A0K8NXR1_PISS1|nr:MlaD family protein [Piscinibacter sakaiensis]GAP35153.1 MCE-family protein MCE4B [Piscinibacter sakaiensis]
MAEPRPPHAPPAGAPAAPPPVPGLPPMPAPADVPPVAHLDLKARAVLWGVALLLLAAAAYVAYARGAFERQQRLVLVADHAEGVVVGMDLSFSGFPIGRVRRIELSDQGNARIVIDVPVKDARWLRRSSVFTMESGLVGGPRLRAYSGILSDPPLEDGAVRPVLAGDVAAEVPKLLASVRDLVANLGALTAKDAPLDSSLRQLATTTERLNGPQGALGVLLGDAAQQRRILATLDKTNALLERLDQLARTSDRLAGRVDGLAAKADAQVFGETGLLVDTRQTVAQLNGLLGDARASLKRVDGVLADAQGIAANTRAATVDLGALRAEVEASLRKVEQLVNDVNRRWPFARETEVKLP